MTWNVGAPGRAADQQSDFDETFCGLLPTLYRRAALLTTLGDAEDCVHEVYLRLQRRPAGFLEHPQPYAYAFRVLINVLRDSRRRSRRHVPAMAELEEKSTGDEFEYRESEWQVAWLMRNLTTKQAAAVLLVDLDGCTIDQAAQILRVHRGTVSRSRARALDLLRAMLEAQAR
jgi:RNA polymerase sigma factor (sigma-70 family)